MPSPLASDLYVKPLLTDMAVAWIQDEANFAADKVFPVVPVQRQSAYYAQWNKEDFFRDPGAGALRGLSQESVGTKYHTSTDSYNAKVYSVHKDIDEQERVNAMAPFDPDRAAVQIVTQQLMIRRERDWAADYFTAGKWGTDLTGVSASPSGSQFLQWDQAASDPVADVDNQKAAVAVTGFTPNVLCVDYQTHLALKSNAAIVDRIKYGGSSDRPAVVTEKTLAQVFEVDKYVIAKGVYTTSADGATSGTTGFIMSKGALLAYAPPAPSIMVPSAGYIFSWAGLLGMGALGIRMKQFPMTHLSSDRVEGDMAYDMGVVAADLGVFFSGTIA